MDFKIDKEFDRLLREQTKEEKDLLRQQLQAEGCRDPLVIWAEEGLLLDGHNRFRLCQELSLPYRTEEISLPDRQAALLWILENQLSRRNLSDVDRIEAALVMEPLIKKNQPKGGRPAKGEEKPTQKSEEVSEDRLFVQKIKAAYKDASVLISESKSLEKAGRIEIKNAVPIILARVYNKSLRGNKLQSWPY